MIIGRDKEQRELHEAYESEYSEFAVVYGRRRVGKTFLVRETFNYTFTFEHSGSSKGQYAGAAFALSVIHRQMQEWVM